MFIEGTKLQVQRACCMAEGRRARVIIRLVLFLGRIRIVERIRTLS